MSSDRLACPQTRSHHDYQLKMCNKKLYDTFFTSNLMQPLYSYHPCVSVSMSELELKLTLTGYLSPKRINTSNSIFKEIYLDPS